MKKPGPKPLPKRLKRVHVGCTVLPSNAKELQAMAKGAGGIGRVIESMMAEIKTLRATFQRGLDGSRNQ